MTQRNLPSSRPLAFRNAAAASSLRRFTPNAPSGPNSITGHVTPWSSANFSETESRKKTKRAPLRSSRASASRDENVMP